MFHPAFRGHTPNNGMEVEQITSLVSIFSFGQQLFNNADTSNQSSSPNKKTKEVRWQALSTIFELRMIPTTDLQKVEIKELWAREVKKVEGSG